MEKNEVFERLLDFSRRINVALDTKYWKYVNDKTANTLAKNIKIGEEVGELMEQVLTYLKLQRQEKVAKFKFSDLEGEYADVIITTMIAADSMGIDIKKVLKIKLGELEEKYFEKK